MCLLRDQLPTARQVDMQPVPAHGGQGRRGGEPADAAWRTPSATAPCHPHYEGRPVTAVGVEPRDIVIVAALACGATHEQAGTAAGCAGRTVRRRLAEPTVRAALEAERTRLASEVADALTGNARAAVERLRRVVDDDADRDAVNAARVLLDQMVKHRDHTWINERLDDIEARLTVQRSRGVA